MGKGEGMGEGVGEGVTARHRRVNKVKGIAKLKTCKETPVGLQSEVDEIRQGFAKVWQDVHVAKENETMFPVTAMNMWAKRYLKYKRVRCRFPYIHFSSCRSKLLMGCVFRRRSGASAIKIYDENIHNETEFVETVMHELAHWVVDSHGGQFGNDTNNCCDCNGSKGHQHDAQWKQMFNLLYPLR